VLIQDGIERRNCLLDVGEISWDIGKELTQFRAGSVNITLANDPQRQGVGDRGIFGNLGNLGFFEGLRLDTVILVFIDAAASLYKNLPQLAPLDSETFLADVSFQHGVEATWRLLPRFCGIIDTQSINYTPAIHAASAADQIVRQVQFQVFGLENLVKRFDSSVVFDPATDLPYDNIEAANPGDFMPAGYTPGDTDHTRATPVHTTLLSPVVEAIFDRLRVYLPATVGMQYVIEMDGTTVIGFHFQVLPDQDFPTVTRYWFLYFARLAGDFSTLNVGMTENLGQRDFGGNSTGTGWDLVFTDFDNTYFGRRYKFVMFGYADIDAALAGLALASRKPPYIFNRGIVDIGGTDYAMLDATFGWEANSRKVYELIEYFGIDSLWHLKVAESTWDGATYGVHADLFLLSSSTDTHESHEKGACLVYHPTNAKIYVMYSDGIYPELFYLYSMDTDGSNDTLLGVDLLPGDETLIHGDYAEAAEWLIFHTWKSVFVYHLPQAFPGSGGTPAGLHNWRPYRIDTELNRTYYDILPYSFMAVPNLGRIASDPLPFAVCLCRDNEKVYLWTCRLQQTAGAWGLDWAQQNFYLVTDSYTYEQGQTDYDLDYSPEDLGGTLQGALYGFVGTTPFRITQEAGFIVQQADLSDARSNNLMQAAADIALLTQCVGSMEYTAIGGIRTILYRHRQFDWSGAASPQALDGPVPTYPPEWSLLRGRPADMPFQPLSRFCTDGVEVSYGTGTERPRLPDGTELGDFDHAINPLSITTKWTWSRTLARYYAQRYYDLFFSQFGMQVKVWLSRWKLLDLVTVAAKRLQIVGIKENILTGNVSLDLMSRPPKPTTDPESCADIVWGIAQPVVRAQGLQGIQDNFGEYSVNLPCYVSCGDPWYFLLLAMAQQSETGPWNQGEFSVLINTLVDCIHANCPAECGQTQPTEVS